MKAGSSGQLTEYRHAPSLVLGNNKMERLYQLSKVFHCKTNVNPNYIRQFMVSLFAKGLLVWHRYLSMLAANSALITKWIRNVNTHYRMSNPFAVLQVSTIQGIFIQMKEDQHSS